MVISQSTAMSTPSRSSTRWRSSGPWTLVDIGPRARKAAPRHGLQTPPKPFSAGGGRSVDVVVRSRRAQRCQKGLISRSFAKPSDGLEPSTPPYHFFPAPMPLRLPDASLLRRALGLPEKPRACPQDLSPSCPGLATRRRAWAVGGAPHPWGSARARFIAEREWELRPAAEVCRS